MITVTAPLDIQFWKTYQNSDEIATWNFVGSQGHTAYQRWQGVSYLMFLGSEQSYSTTERDMTLLSLMNDGVD